MTEELVQRLRERLVGAAALVCVDGMAGAGKTSVARSLADWLGNVTVISADELYRPEEQPVTARREGEGELGR